MNMTVQNLLQKFIKSKPITKGWSEDKKYCVTNVDGTKYLLRISPIERYDHRKNLHEMMQQVSDMGVPMCQPIDFGTCDDGVFSLQSWIEGEDLEDVLPLLSETAQYVLGLQSGEILRKIHSIPAPETQEDWSTRFTRKTDYKIEKYHECGIRFEGDADVIRYIEQNKGLLENRPQCFQHGDYHVGNMMFENGELKIIDFDRYDFGDPWEEFNRIVWCAQKSPHFATGQLRGYFDGEPPLGFFKLLAFYIGSNTLSSIYWALDFDNIELETMMNQAKDVLSWYDNMSNPVPTWYLKDFYIQYIDGIPYKLKSPFDFSFLSKYGKVFKVFDDQDGGNVCFGTEKDGKRYFVKFAGAPQARYDGKIEDAIARLKASVKVYQDIGNHPGLIRFIGSEEIGGGFAVLYEWTDALGMARMYPLNHRRFMALSIEKRIRVFEEILMFHAFICERGYVAIDFYDGSIMYDFENEKTVICDIDFYQKMPYHGEMGLWGSSRFVSPEECKQGEIMDEITTVYTMGATAFCLFTDSDRSFEAWPLSEKQYDVIEKAVSDEREDRQQSIKQLIEEWEAAK